MNDLKIYGVYSRFVAVFFLCFFFFMFLMLVLFFSPEQPVT